MQSKVNGEDKEIKDTRFLTSSTEFNIGLCHHLRSFNQSTIFS